MEQNFTYKKRYWSLLQNFKRYFEGDHPKESAILIIESDTFELKFDQENYSEMPNFDELMDNFLEKENVWYKIFVEDEPITLKNQYLRSIQEEKQEIDVCDTDEEEENRPQSQIQPSLQKFQVNTSEQKTIERLERKIEKLEESKDELRDKLIDAQNQLSKESISNKFVQEETKRIKEESLKKDEIIQKINSELEKLKKVELSELSAKLKMQSEFEEELRIRLQRKEDEFNDRIREKEEKQKERIERQQDEAFGKLSDIYEKMAKLQNSNNVDTVKEIKDGIEALSPIIQMFMQQKNITNPLPVTNNGNGLIMKPQGLTNGS